MLNHKKIIRYIVSSLVYLKKISWLISIFLLLILFGSSETHAAWCEGAVATGLDGLDAKNTGIINSPVTGSFAASLGRKDLISAYFYNGNYWQNQGQSQPTRQPRW